MEYSTSGYRELITTLVTVILITFKDFRDAFRTTTWTDNTVRPTNFFKVFTTFVFAMKAINNLPKKKITERETEDALKRLFPKKILDRVKEIAHEKDKPKAPINKG